MATNKSDPAKSEARAAEKAANFKRLASARVNKSLDAISTLRGLANKNTYTYTSAQVDAMFGAIETELTRIRAMFDPEAATEVETGFTFN